MPLIIDVQEKTLVVVPGPPLTVSIPAAQTHARFVVEGPAGFRGSWWWTGSEPPPTITGAAAHDLYLDLATGDVWAFVPPSGGLGYGFGSYGAGPYGGMN